MSFEGKSFEDKFISFCDEFKLSFELKKDLMQLCSDHLFVYERTILICYNDFTQPLSNYPINIHHLIIKGRNMGSCYIDYKKTIIETRPEPLITVDEVKPYCEKLGLNDKFLVDRLNNIIIGYECGKIVASIHREKIKKTDNINDNINDNSDEFSDDESTDDEDDYWSDWTYSFTDPGIGKTKKN